MFKAKLTKGSGQAKNLKNGKEQISAYAAVVLYKGDLVEPVRIRVFMGRSNSARKMTASVWLSSENEHTSGMGHAGGSGYCKESHAICKAFNDAGVEFTYAEDQTYYDVHENTWKVSHKKGASAYWEGTGSQAIDDGIKAVVRALGYRGQVRIVKL